MRGWILVGAGIALLWLVVSQLRPTSAKSAAPPGDELGLLSSLEPEGADDAQFLSRPRPRSDEVSLVPAATAAPIDGAVPRPSSPLLSAEARPARTSPEPASVSTARSDEPLADAPPARGTAQALPWTAEDAILLASTLLHEPRAVGAFLDGRSAQPSAGQRALALALAAAVEGDRGRARLLAEGLANRADVLPIEVEVLERAIGTENSAAIAAASSPAASDSIRRDSFLAQAACMALLAREGTKATNAGRFQHGAEIFSTLLLAEIEAPWEAEAGTLAEWSRELERAQLGWRWNRNAPWPAIEVTVQPGDSLTTVRKRALAQRSDLQICTGLIARANELRGHTIHPGDVLRIPTEPCRVRVDVSARWIFYMHGEEVVAAWQVGVGAPGRDTRTGNYTVGEKQEEPMWFRPGEPPVPFGDPANPLGTRWISWLLPDGRESSLGFHGTNEPDSMGRAVSEGCIRMRNAQVEELFEILPRGASIVVTP